MNTTLIEISGIVPAIIFPAATLIQLLSMLRNKTAQGVSALTWTLFGIANIGMYIFTEKYTSIQTLAGFIGTALLDFIIVALVITSNNKTPQKN